MQLAYLAVARRSLLRNRNCFESICLPRRQIAPTAISLGSNRNPEEVSDFAHCIASFEIDEDFISRALRPSSA